MAARPSQDRSLPHSHTHISASDTLLASRIALPPQPRISYALYKPASPTTSPTDALEHARRSVLSRNASASLLDSILPTVRIDSSPFMYIFRVTHEHPVDGAADELEPPIFDGLSVTERSSFVPQNITSVSPDHDKRRVYSYFLEAVRSRIIDDIVATSIKSPSRRRVKRFKSGFLMSQPSTSWDWEYKATTRPLIFCHLQIHFSYNSSGVPTHLIVHPMLLSTPFLDLPRTLPIPAGTPITLLPYGAPAYFLANYTGPTSGLVKQFQESLQGMGAGDWADPKHSTAFDTPFQSTPFIIGWIKVENKQGEDKGTTAIYPANLCLSYMPLSTPRSPLDFVPELPAPLQPSPQVAPVHPSDRMELGRSLLDTPTYHPLRPSILSSPTSESLHSFRALTLSRTKDMKQVATEVGGYVDAVARDRERERERLKREREGGTSSSPKLTRTTATTPASVPTPMSVDTTSNVPQHTSQYPLNNQAGTSQLPAPIQPSISAQMFYPSPPQLLPMSAPTTDSKTSPIVESAPSFPPDDAMVTDTGIPATEAPLEVDSTAAPLSASNQYEPFGNLDPSWAQSSDNFMGMDFGMDDIEMTFGMNMSNTTSAGGAYSGHRTGTGMEFEDAFTDDDFSFLDRPARPAATPAATHFSNNHSRVASGSGTHPLATSSLPHVMPPLLFEDVHLSGTAPPNSTSQNQQLFTPGAFLDGFTPRSVDHYDSIPPELLPSSPGPTPGSHSVPNTPNVHLEYDPAIKRPGTSSGQSSNTFEPIPFAPYHRAADGKYAVGKFAFQLPSPPAEEDLPECAYHSLPTSPNGSNGWRFRYNAITDPRIGVVRKLIGVKRKTPIQGVRDPPKASPWSRAHEEWDQPAKNKEDDGDAKSEAESDEEDPDDVESPLMSRPTTPPPSYLPHGPTLLHTQFQHAQLLSLSVPLRPPGAAVAPTNLTSNPVPSVPTPVSPAATMGAASEKSKSLEGAAFTVAAEVVENPVWAQSWRAMAAGTKSNSSIWATDVKAISQLLESVPSLEAPCCLGTVFGLDTGKILQPLEAPMISIGKADSIIQILPTALRFWEKLGLGPKSGRKDVAAFVLFEDDGESRQGQIADWLAGVRDAYQGKHFGTLSPGKSDICPKDGLVPLLFDTSFRKVLSLFMSNLDTSHQTVVIFLVLPVTIMTLSSPTLRQIISISKKAINNFEDSHLTFEFVPEQYIFGAYKSSSCDSALDMFSSSIYDRILVPVDRVVSRRIHNQNGHNRNFFRAPLFTLARPLYNKVSYVRAPHTSLDVMDRYTLLHVGYHLTVCGKWILAACVDQRGENHALEVWLTQSPGEHDGEIDLTEEEYVIRKIWEFATGFAKKANVEWRMVIARLGVMSEREQDAWTNQLTVHVLTSREQPPLHVSLVCVEPDASWSFLTSSKLTPTPPSPPQSRSNPPNRTSSASKPHSVFTDVSTTTYVLYPSTRIPISLSPSHLDLGLCQSYIPEPTPTPSSSLPPSPTSPEPHISMNPHASRTLGPESAAPAPNPMAFPVDPPPEYEPHAITFLPLHTSILVYVPNTGSSTAIAMTNIHLLKTFHSRSYTHSVQSSSSSSAVPSDEQLTVDMTKNYHDLAVLARTRWKLGSGLAANNQAHAHLPFHLAAVDAMRAAVDRDWDRFENIGEV